jgi:hypothetical protein
MEGAVGMLKHRTFQVVADQIAELPLAFDERYWRLANISYREYLCYEFMQVFAQENPKFDKARFMKACGVDNPLLLEDNLIHANGILIDSSKVA